MNPKESALCMLRLREKACRDCQRRREGDRLVQRLHKLALRKEARRKKQGSGKYAQGGARNGSSLENALR